MIASAGKAENLGGKLQIRARISADAPQITALHNLPGYRFGTLRMPYHSVEEIRRAIEGQPPNMTSLVAILDEQVVGDATLSRLAGRRAHCGNIGMGVHDNYTGRGIGRALLGELVMLADRWLNLRRLELTVFIDNEPALALYRSFGFAVEGTLKEYAFRDGAFVDVHSLARLRG